MGESQAQADVCVVCALAEEARAFLEVVQQVHQILWSSHVDVHGYQYQQTTVLNENEEPLKLHVSWLARPNATTMTHHLSRVVETTHPRFVVMPGICAGVSRHGI